MTTTLRLLAACAAILASSVQAEVNLRSNAGIYGEVIKVNNDLLVTVALNSPELEESVQFTARLEQSDLDPFTLSVVLQGRYIFCFPVAQPVNSEPFELANCYVNIGNFPGFSEKANFVSIGYILGKLRK